MNTIGENRIQELLLEPYSSERDDILSGDSGEEDNLEISDHQKDSEQSEEDTNDPLHVVPETTIPVYDVRRNTNFMRQG